MNDAPPEEFRNIEDLLRMIISQTLGSGHAKPGLVGVNIIVAGGLPPGFPGFGGGGSGGDTSHPQIEVFEYDGKVVATCELKGLSDEHVSVAVADNILHIIGFDGKVRYRTSAPIPPIDEASCIRTFFNGILELVYLTPEHYIEKIEMQLEEKIEQSDINRSEEPYHQ